jgi:outer membrane lipoprotein carrier protein
LFRKVFFLLVFVGFFIEQLCASDITIEPFKADFIQTVTNTSNKSVKYKGNIYINGDDDILWRYKTPTIKNIYINKDKLVIEEPELEQAIFTSLKDKLNLTLLLLNAKLIKDNRYSATVYGVDYLIVLNNNKIRQIRYKDNLDNTIVISFFSIENNPIYEDDFFVFKAKDYYDIIIK